MRERLGIESRDQLNVDDIRKKRLVKEEQATALNRVLQKEVSCRALVKLKEFTTI